MPATEFLWTEERKRRFFELNESGMSQYEIGAALGLAPNTIKNVRSRFGVGSARPRPDFWPTEKEESLRALWAEGKSGGEIAKILGGTRNAIIGKAHRMGLPARKTVTRMNKAGPRAARIRAVRKAPTKKTIIRDGRLYETVSINQDLPPSHADNPCTILTLQGCRWPCDGSGLGTMFCGGEKFGDLSYCARHCRMAYRRR